MGAFSTDDSIEFMRFHKQGGKCALCDKELVLANYRKGWKGAWNAHHIDGNPNNNRLSNCAVVCVNEPENCHLKTAHGGNFRTGRLAPKSWYRLNR